MSHYTLLGLTPSLKTKRTSLTRSAILLAGTQPKEDEHLFVQKPKGEHAVDGLFSEKVTCPRSYAWRGTPDGAPGFGERELSPEDGGELTIQ